MTAHSPRDPQAAEIATAAGRLTGTPEQLGARLAALLDAGAPKPPKAGTGSAYEAAADHRRATQRHADEVAALRHRLAADFAGGRGWRATTAPLAVKELAARSGGGNWHRPPREWFGSLLSPTFYRDAERRAAALVAHVIAAQAEQDRDALAAWAAERDLAATFPDLPSWQDPAGSVLAVLEPCEREKALLKALAPWRVPGKPPHQRWTRELKDWGSLALASKMPGQMRVAVEDALPWPSTFAEAQAELVYWRERNDDMEHALGRDGQFLGDGGLDRVCVARMDLIRDLVEHEMRLGTLPEILERFRIFHDREVQDASDMEAALLRDLETLAARSTVEPAFTPEQRSAAPSTNRPALAGQIEDALAADPSRSDRAIARALGCSPTTVGQIRGRMGLAGVRRSVQRGGQIYGMGRRAAPAGEGA